MWLHVLAESNQLRSTRKQQHHTEMFPSYCQLIVSNQFVRQQSLQLIAPTRAVIESIVKRAHVTRGRSDAAMVNRATSLLAGYIAFILFLMNK